MSTDRSMDKEVLFDLRSWRYFPTPSTQYPQPHLDDFEINLRPIMKSINILVYISKKIRNLKKDKSTIPLSSLKR